MMQISHLQKIHSQKTVLYSVICTLFAMAKSPSKQLLWRKQFWTMFNNRHQVTGCDWKMFNTTDLSARGLTHKMKWFSKYSRQWWVAGLEHPQGPLPRMQGKDLSLVQYSETRELATNYLVPKTISLVLPCY